jgi:transmembrane sensor
MKDKGRVIGFARREQMHEQAAAWIMKLDSGPLAPEERRALQDWLQQSDLHRRVLADTARVWDRMDVLSGLSGLAAPQPRGRSLVRWVPALAAGLAALVVVFWWQERGAAPVTSQPAAAVVPARAPAARVFETAMGETKVVSLADGSVVHLNTVTRVRTSVSATRRVVALLSGEAYFEVAKNEKAPFVVVVDGTEIAALGTAFSVRKMEHAVKVTVAEGIVQVQRGPGAAPGPDAPAFQPVLLRAGQAAEVGSPGVQAIRSMAPQELARELLWQQRILAFDGSTLQEVVDEYRRYTPLKISIADAETAAIRVGGYFRSDNVAGLLTSLEQNFGIAVRQTGSDSFELQKTARTQ